MMADKAIVRSGFRLSTTREEEALFITFSPGLHPAGCFTTMLAFQVHAHPEIKHHEHH